MAISYSVSSQELEVRSLNHPYSLKTVTGEKYYSSHYIKFHKAWRFYVKYGTQAMAR